MAGLTGQIVSAKLRTWITDGSSNGPAAYLTGPFSETTLTWANRPATQGTATDDKGKLPANAYADYDVTRLISGNGTYYLTTVATSSDGTDAASRETAKPPTLVLTVR